MIINYLKLRSKMSENSASNHYEFNKRINPIGDKNIWVEYTGLAREYNAVNLGQVYIIQYEIFKLKFFKFLRFSFRVSQIIKVQHS